MKNSNKILDFTITLYSNRCKVVKEVVAKPTELEKVIDLLDQEASIPRKGDGHHGYYIEVEIRRHKDVHTSNGNKRCTKSAKRKTGAVHSGGRRHEDDRQSGSSRRPSGVGVRSGVDGVSDTTTKTRARSKAKAGQTKKGEVNGKASRTTKGRRKSKVS